MCNNRLIPVCFYSSMKTEEKEMERKELEQEQSEKTAIGRLFHCTKRATSGFHTYPKEKQSLVSDDPNCRRLSLDTNCNIFHSKLSYAFFLSFFFQFHKHRHCQIPNRTQRRHYGNPSAKTYTNPNHKENKKLACGLSSQHRASHVSTC